MRQLAHAEGDAKPLRQLEEAQRPVERHVLRGIDRIVRMVGMVIVVVMALGLHVHDCMLEVAHIAVEHACASHGKRLPEHSDEQHHGDELAQHGGEYTDADSWSVNCPTSGAGNHRECASISSCSKRSVSYAA